MQHTGMCPMYRTVVGKQQPHDQCTDLAVFTAVNRLSYDSSGLGIGCSGEMTRRVALLLILEIITVGFTPGMQPLNNEVIIIFFSTVMF